jgi:hypothetical protein
MIVPSSSPKNQKFLKKNSLATAIRRELKSFDVRPQTRLDVGPVGRILMVKTKTKSRILKLLVSINYFEHLIFVQIA